MSREQPSEPRRVGRQWSAPPGHDHLRHREREQALGSGDRGDPLVRAHPGERQAWADIHELRGRSGTARLERVGVRERVLVADGREPRLHEVGAERHDVARGGEIVPRNSRRAEGEPVPLPQRLEGERLVGHVPAAGLPHPGIDQVAERPRLEPGDEDDTLAPGRLDLSGETSDRVVPRELLPLAGRRPGHRVGDAIGVVQALKRRLAARAQPPLVDRRVGIPLELDHPAFADLGVQPASGRALAAGGGVVRGDAGNLVLGRDDVGDEVLGRLGADAARRHSGGRPARGAQDCEEPPPIHALGSQ